MIKKIKGKFELYSKDGTKHLGSFTTKEEAQAREDEIKLKIISTMQDAEMMISQGMTICTYKEQSSTRIDSTLLKKEEPELFAKYSKTSSTRVFRISNKFKETI